MKKILLPIVLLALVSCQSDFDDKYIESLLDNEAPSFNSIETINKENELYNYLGLVTKSQPELTDVGCIEFIYPFVVYQFDDNNEYVNRTSISGNDNFAELIGNLSQGYSIGFSYPISGNLTDGTAVTINNNAELQQSLQTCIEEELEIIIGNCNGIIQDCVWKVANSDNEESPYIDSFFTMRNDGSVVFSVLQQNEEEEEEEEETNENEEETEPVYEEEVGTWIFYYVGSDLHLNINFGSFEENEEGEIAEEDQIKADWNFDWKASCINDTKITLEKMYTKTVVTEEGNTEETFTEKITLEKECKTPDEEVTNKH